MTLTRASFGCAARGQDLLGIAFPLVIFTCLFLGCGGGGNGPSPTPDPPPDATVTIDNRTATVLAAPMVNRRLLGSNLQWTDDGDGLLQSGTTTFEPGALAGTLALAPTVLRYPGGAQADAYHYAQGIGPTRGTCLHVFNNVMQTVNLGTDEFLDLCQRTGADPLITLNVASAQAAESAVWVTYVNGATPLGRPRVRDWEIGNEPYLTNATHPEFDLSAAQFAAAYDAHAAAIIAADPGVRVGLPLMGPNTARLLPSDRQGFTATVLGAIHQRVDFIAVHDAYLPFIWQTPSGPPTHEEMLRSVLASAPAVDADLNALRHQLAAAGITAPFSLTEYNALMSIGFGLPFDGIPVSLSGAVYIADLICTLAKRDDVDNAAHWSLIGNWYFGAMYLGGAPRPAYRVLLELNKLFVGRRLPVTVIGPSADIPAFGALVAQTGMPLVSGFATGNGEMLRVILINRSTSQAMHVRLTCLGGARAGTTATLQTLNATDAIFAYDDGSATPNWVETSTRVGADGVIVELPAHALVIVRISAPTGGVP